ncbi:methyl-accepting chemotaxis protein [Niallia endozanthoxylica]|uniref:Methyl-accepting chemotaxis protein n=2 Tax=Niallia endozanthoxylica TaxID=2036016 RepID=A0A5J5HRR8_9BACI|nr:methyl-accepting chemotaxis protein [Niallia endozanthoxylica]
MLNMRKNLKIVHIVTIMAIIAVLFMGIIGFFSTNRMASMNDDNRLLYNENLIPLTQISSMRGTFSNIRISVRDYSTRQDVKLPDSIQADYKKITDLIHSYSSSRANYIKSSQNDEAMHVKNITKQLSLYLSTWEDAKQEIDTTGILSDTKFDELDLIGTDLYASLTALKEMNEQEAKSANNNSLQTYESSNKTIFYLFSSVAIIFGFIVVITVISIKRSAKEMISLLNTVANGDFTLKIDQGYQNEFGLMKKALANTVEDIKTMILTVKEKSKHIEYQADNLGIVFEEMSAATQSVSQSINEVAKGTSSQSENLADITTILDDFRMEMDSIVISINKVAESAGHVDGMAKDSSTKMTVLSDSIIEVNSAAKALKDKISNLESSINKISNITNLINGIADQTNLLALNASIEAARAGEAGKGFSVVAEEIRKLAEQSKLSSENIHKLVVEISLETKDMVNTSDDMIKDVNDQIEVTNTSVISFKNIIRAINDIIPKMQSINGSMGKLQTNQGVILDKLQGASAVAQEVAASAEEISSSSQQMNASTEEVSASANQLSAISKDVIVEIDKFTL